MSGTPNSVEKRQAPEFDVGPLLRDLLAHLAPPAAEDRKVLSTSEGDELVVAEVEIDDLHVVVTRKPRSDLPRPPHLSPREREIARMVARGYPNKTIAAVLEISPWTVSTHLRRIFAKLGVSCRAEMVARLIEQQVKPAALTAADDH